MSSKYRSQQMPRISTIDDLVNFMLQRQGANSSSGGITQNQAFNNQNEGLDALIQMISSSTNLSDLTNNALIANDLNSVISGNNIEGQVKKAQVNQNLVNTTQDYVNYENSINIGYNLLNKYTMPEYFEADFTQEELIRAKDYIDKNYAADNTVNQSAYNFMINNPNFDINTANIRNGKIVLEGADADAQKAIYNTELYTIDNIQNAINAIDTIEANLYTDPLARNKEHQFVGDYFHDDGSGNKTQDIQIIKQLGIGKDAENIGGLKNKLLTALSALEGDKLITNNEIYYILAGDQGALDEARTQNIKDSRNSLTSYRRSMNTIKRFQKDILSYIAKNNLDPKEMKFDFGMMGEFKQIQDSLLQVTEIDEQNPSYEGMDEESIRAEKLNMFDAEDFTVSDLLQYWARELAKYQILTERESKRFKIWANKDFELNILNDALIDEQMAKNLEKYKD